MNTNAQPASVYGITALALLYMYCSRLPGLVALTFLSIWSCERPSNPIEEGTLTFSVDTVMFDSIFTTFLTPSERLIVSNNTGRAVKVSRIGHKFQYLPKQWLLPLWVG